MLGLELYARVSDCAGKQQRALAAETQSLASSIQRLRELAQSKRQAVERLRGDATYRDSEMELAHVRVRTRGAVRVREAAEKELAGLEAKLADAVRAHDARMKVWQVAAEQYEKARGQLSQEIETKRIEFARETLRCESLGKQMRALKKLSGAVCPSCRQQVDEKHVKAVMVKLEAETRQAGVGADGVGIEVLGLENQLGILQMPVQPYDDIVSQIKAAVGDARIRSASASSRAAEVSKALASAEQEFAQMAAHVASLEAEADKLEREAAEQEERKISASGKLSRMEFIQSAYGNQGIKSFLLDGELPHINARATEIAIRLLGEGAVVSLSATTMLKKGESRERISIAGVIPGCTDSYSGASTGQKARMDLAILWAFKCLIGSRAMKSFDQLFIDEILDGGVDTAGVEGVCELVQEVAQSHPVVLISHKDKVKSIADRIITVTHDGDKQSGTSSLTSRGGPLVLEKARKVVQRKGLVNDRLLKVGGLQLQAPLRFDQHEH